jgi:hypothetical protein
MATMRPKRFGEQGLLLGREGFVSPITQSSLDDVGNVRRPNVPPSFRKIWLCGIMEES